MTGESAKAVDQIICIIVSSIREVGYHLCEFQYLVQTAEHTPTTHESTNNFDDPKNVGLAGGSTFEHSVRLLMLLTPRRLSRVYAFA